jgi:hypothetical protein
MSDPHKSGFRRFTVISITLMQNPCHIGAFARPSS